MRLFNLAHAATILLISQTLSAQTPGLYDEDTLRSIHLTFATPSWYTDLVNNRSTGRSLQADMVVDGNLYQQVGVRMTGNDSFHGTTSQKKSLAISMDEFIPGQDLMGFDDLNLHNGFNDPTMLRQVIGYKILRRYMPAPLCNSIKVYINQVYWGLYVNIQQVDKRMIRDWFQGDDGNRYLAEATTPSGRGNSALQDLGTALQPYINAYELKNGLAKAVQPWEDVRDLCGILNNSPQLGLDLPRVFDFDQVLWYLAFYNVAANLNGYNDSGSDYYLYHDEQHDLLTILPSDMAGAFGASPNQTVTQASTQSPFVNESKSSRPLLGKLWGEPEWRARYVHHMKTILDESFTWTEVGPLATAHAKVIDTALQTDTKKLYSYQDALDNITRSVTINSGSHTKTVPGLEQLCDDRNAYLRGLSTFRSAAPSISNVTITPASPQPNTQVTITATVANTVALGPVALHYRAEGGQVQTGRTKGYVADPMFDDGLHGDGAANDGVFGAFVPSSVQDPGAVVRFYIGARSAPSAGGAVTYEPPHGQRDALRYITQWAIGSSPVGINELMAKNDSTIRDSAGDFDDWLELFNSSSSVVALDGMFLTDDLLNSTKWEIPSGTVIPAGGTLLFWCDEDRSQGPTHTNFKLSAKGEQVWLFDRDKKTVLSTIAFGPLDADVSIGWLEDGKQSDLVAYRLHNGDGFGASPDAPNDPPRGPRDYWPLDYANHRLFLRWGGMAQIDTTNAILARGPANSQLLMLIGLQPGVLPLGGGLHFLIGGTLAGPFHITTNAAGAGVTVFKIPNDPNLVGTAIYLQTGGTDASGFTVSNGAQARFSR